MQGQKLRETECYLSRNYLIFDATVFLRSLYRSTAYNMSGIVLSLVMLFTEGQSPVAPEVVARESSPSYRTA